MFDAVGLVADGVEEFRYSSEVHPTGECIPHPTHQFIIETYMVYICRAQWRLACLS